MDRRDVGRRGPDRPAGRTARDAAGENPVLRGLNPAQKQAVSTLEGPLLVLAGAGTGKTKVITHRIANLLRHGIPTENILAVTFTNKAAKEMRERVETLLGDRPRELVLSTFHALGMRILRAEAETLGLRSGFTIYDSADQVSLVRSILRDVRGAGPSSDADRVHTLISLAKNRLETPGDFLDRAQDDFEVLVARTYTRYAESLRHLNAVDFDDLILLPVRLLEESSETRKKYQERFRYVLIDEYQDTNGAQYRFTRALIGAERNICVVGDDDQSIYGFRGAEVDKILRFEKDFPGAQVVKLEENYRSTGAILELANAVIAQSPGRNHKALRTTAGQGRPVEWTEASDGEAEVAFVLERLRDHNAQGVQWGEMAILLRSSFQARAFEEKLRLQRVPYKLVGGQSWFDRKEIRDVLAYWTAAVNPSDDVAFLRIINVPQRGIGTVTVEKLDRFARETGMRLQEAARKIGNGDGEFQHRVREAFASVSAHFQQARSRLASGSAAAMARALLEDVGYREAIKDLYTDPLIRDARWASVEDLIKAVAEWEARNPGERFSAYLNALLLEAKDDADDKEKAVQRVHLMTLHSAKGLEFPVVFIAGVEEEILPHRRSIADGDRGIEEERRLFYVGITRARTQLYLTSAKVRAYARAAVQRLPSRFLGEVSDRPLVQKREYNPQAVAGADVARRYRELYRSRVAGRPTSPGGLTSPEGAFGAGGSPSNDPANDAGDEPGAGG